MENENTVPAIHAAVVSIADELRQVGIGKKKGSSDGIKYAFRSIDDVYAALSPLLAKYKLYIRPKAMQVLSSEVCGKQRLSRILVTYVVTSSEDGSSIEAQAVGEGADSTDKAAGKAMSYAYKSLMFQLFCIPVVGQHDPDKEEVQLPKDATFADESLVAKAREASSGGVAQFRAFWRSCPECDRNMLTAAGVIEELKTIAKAADAKMQEVTA